MNAKMRALFLGDVFGQPGCRALFIGLKQLINKYKADLTIVNGENACDGFGITPEIADQLFYSGADVITTGNHIWQQQSIIKYLDEKTEILRPNNYPPGVPGKGMCFIESKKFGKAAVINLQGRTDLSRIDCPFREAQGLIKKIRQETKLIFIDFHAENVEEKEALGLYLDGQVSAIIGTHTHVPTADERILSKGSAYISDAGMTGPADSVIGCKPNISIERALTQIPIKMEVMESNAVINGVLIETDMETGKSLSIERISVVSAL